MWRNWNIPTFLVGQWTNSTVLESCLAVPKRLNIGVNIWLNNSTSRYMPKRHWNTCPYKNMYTKFVTALFIVTKMWKQLKEWMTKQMWYIYTMEYYLPVKKMKYWYIYKTDGPWKTCQVKEDRHKMLHMIPCICPEQANLQTGSKKQVSGCLGVKRSGEQLLIWVGFVGKGTNEMF